MLFALLGFGISVAAAMFGYYQSRLFVSHRLKFVDAVHGPLIPLAAGAVAAVVALPVVAFLPIVGVGTAIGFGLSVWMGVRAGVRDIRKQIGGPGGDY